MPQISHTSQKIPKLRFREFQSEWEEKKIWKISDVRDGTHDSPKYQDEGFPLLTSKNLLSNWRIDYENVNYISQLDYENINKRSKVNIGDILFGMIWSIGNPVIVKRDDFAIKNVALIKEKEEIQNSFLIHYLNSDPIIRQFYRVNIWGAQKFIALWVIRDLPVRFPALPEQQKIASFLSSIDTYIEQLREKKSLLEVYKRWVMQKIFAREIRFKDENGEEYGEWEERRIDEIFFCEKWQGLSKSMIKTSWVNKCILYGELYTTYKTQISEVKSFTDHNDWIYSNIWDLLVPCSTTTNWADLVNFTALNENWILLGGDISILRFKESGSNIFYAYFLTNFKKKEIAQYAQWSTIFHLSFTNFKHLKIKIPQTVEQQKIASFLSEIDTRIQFSIEQIKEAENWKKGLLQGMFI